VEPDPTLHPRCVGRSTCAVGADPRSEMDRGRVAREIPTLETEQQELDGNSSEGGICTFLGLVLQRGAQQGRGNERQRYVETLSKGADQDEQSL